MTKKTSLRATLLRLLLFLQLSAWAKPADEFADVNAILANVAVKMPSVPTMESGGYSIDLTDVVCRDVSIRDASLTSRSLGLVGGSASGIRLQWSIEGLAFECDANYKYTGLLGIVNRGDVYLYSRDNRAVTTATVSAPLTGSPQPPTEVTMDSCNPEVQIVDIDFENGGFLGWVLDAIEGLMRTTMENIASDKICKELQAFLEESTEDLLKYIAGENVLKPYLPTPTTTTTSAGAVVDPLQLENDFIKRLELPATNEMNNNITTITSLATTRRNNTSNTKLLNLRRPDTSVGRWINELIQKGVAASTEMVPRQSNYIIGEELLVNQWLRDLVLEEGSGAFVLSSSSSGPDGFPGGGILYDGEDQLTHTTIVLDRVKLFGLDTLTRFKPFETIGDLTLETKLAWKYLALEVDATVTVLPSTRVDSVIEATASSSSMKIVEEVKLVLGVDGFEVEASLMAALNRTALENSIEVGSLMKSKKAAMDCLLSTIVDLEFATLSVQVTNDILTPSIEGLVSPGLDRLVSQSLDASFLMYEDIILEAAPLYFQNELRPMMTQKLLREHMLLKEQAAGESTTQIDRGGRKCLPWATGLGDGNSNNAKTIDFRDLFLPAEEAIALGGSGSEVYGDVISSIIVPYANKELLDPEALNTRLIPAVTKEQSGKEGVLEFIDVFRYLDTSSSSPLFDTLDFRISKVTVSNLDTVEEPVEFMEPTGSGNVLKNRFAMNTITDAGNDPRYLNATFRVFLGIDGDSSPFQMKNEVDFSVSLPSTSFSVDVLANLKERSLLEFPLKDIANPYCWLAALGNPTKNFETELPIESDKGLSMSDLSFSLSTFYLDTYCVSASSPGCDSMSEVIKQLQDAGLASSFRMPIIGLIEDMAFSLFDTFDVEGIINEAPKRCPHSQLYDSEAVELSLEIPDLSGVSRDSSETFFALGIVGLQTAVIVSAKNHLLADQQFLASTNHSSTTASPTRKFPEGRGIIDWTNLSGQFGGWIEILFDESREYLSSRTVLSIENELITRSLSAEKNWPMINAVLRDYVLDDSEQLVVELENVSFTALGVSISIVQARIGGLDTITGIEPFVVLGPSEMSTALQLEELTIALVCNVTMVADSMTEQVELFYKASGVGLDIDTNIALNTTKIGQVQLGSLFDSSRAINCIMRGIQAFEISKLDLKLDELESPTINGSFSLDLEIALNGILGALRKKYQDEVLSAVPLIAGSTIRKIINSMMPDILESMTIECPTSPEFTSDGLVDFRNLFLPEVESKKLGGGGSSYGDIFQILYGILDKEVMQTGASNRPVLNDLLRKLTEKQSNTTGTIRIAGNALERHSFIQIAGLQADFGIEVLDVLVENLDSVGDPLYLFEPVENSANVLDNKLSFGVDSKPLRFQGTLVVSIDDGAEMKIRNEIELSLLVEDMTVKVSILLKLLENSISSFPLEDFSEMHCWAATILPTSDEGATFEGLQLLDQIYSTGDFDMDISCKSCTSPDFDKFLFSLYEPQDITAAIREQTSSLMDSGFVQIFLNNAILESKRRCPHHPEFDPNYESSDIADSSSLSDAGFGPVPLEKKKNPRYFSIVNSVMATCLIIIGIIGKLILARNNKQWIHSLTNEGQLLLECQQEKQRGMDEWLDENTTSLFTSPSIPKSIRWGVPILLLFNTGLYLGGHFGLLSVVNLDITFAGQSFAVKNFLEFRFFESTKNSYDNGGAEMVILLWICTGIWPYIKLMLSLVIWMTPPKYLSVKRRRTVLLWIDALARLSVIDIFTLIIGFAILLVFLGGRDESMDGGDMYYALKAIVVPKAGCYCIIIAQRMSRVSSQFFLEYHENVVKKATDIRKSREGDMSISRVFAEDPLGGNGSFEIVSPSIRITDGNISDESQSDLERTRPLLRIPIDLSFFTMASWKVYRWGHLGAILGGITIVIVFIIGCAFVPAIAFDVSTIGGIALESEYTYEEAVSEYGVFLVISGILLKARFVLRTKADYIGLGLLLLAGGISVSFTFIIKSYHFIKQKIRDQQDRRNNFDDQPSYGHEGCGLPSYFRLYKWNHMEIYFISVCIGVWQLGSIVSYSIHLYCSILIGTFDILTSFGVVEPTNAQCNRIQASLPGNLFITIGSFLILLVAFYLQAYGQYKKNLKYASEYIDDKDVPTLSLAWSEDKSKNTRYSHLTDSLTLSAIGTSTINSNTETTSVANPPDSIFPWRNESFRSSPSRNFSTRTSSRGNTTILRSPAHTIEEEPIEDDLSVAVPSPALDISDRCSDGNGPIHALCELATPTNGSTIGMTMNNRPIFYSNAENDSIS